MSASTKRRRDEHPARGCQCPIHAARREYLREWWHRNGQKRHYETSAERRAREAREIAVARGELPPSAWGQTA